MSPDAYCEQRLAQADPYARLCLLFAPRDRQPAMTALFVLRHELAAGLASTSDESIGHAKLAWWRDEIRRCATGEPLHPVTRALAPAVRAHGLPVTRLLELADAAGTELAHPGFETLSELLGYCDQSGGALYLLAATTLGARQRDTERFAQNAGIAARLVAVLRDAPMDAAAGRMHLPGDLLRRHGVGPEDLSSPQQSPAVRAALAELARTATDRFTRARTLLPDDERTGQRPLILLAALYERLLARIRRHDYGVFSRRIELAPLARLWTVWRAARRESRQRSPDKP